MSLIMLLVYDYINHRLNKGKNITAKIKNDNFTVHSDYL